MQRWSILIIIQRDAKQSNLFIILQVRSTCFGCQPHPSSGLHKTVTTASDTGVATYLQGGQAWPSWREVAAQKIWPVAEAAVTVLCTPDAGCGWHTKHVEWTCRTINRLLCVASRWTVINTGFCNVGNGFVTFAIRQPRISARADILCQIYFLKEQRNFPSRTYFR